MAEPWVEVLRDEARRTSQAKAGARIGYSASVVCQVLKGSYIAGDLSAVRKAVEGALMAATVECPALGMELRTDRCIAFQRATTSRNAGTPHNARLARTCPTCPNNRFAKETTDAEQ